MNEWIKWGISLGLVGLWVMAFVLIGRRWDK